jgi:ribosomal protein S14
MKKLVEKDKKVRKNIKKAEKKKFVLKIILNNINLPYLLRFNASNNLNDITKIASKTVISNRCIATVNKKKFGKLTNYSRIFFLKLVRNNKIHGIAPASW